MNKERISCLIKGSEKMSILYHRIHGIFFNTSLHSSRIPFLSTRTWASTTPLPYRRPRLYPDPELFKERDLRKLVDKFKSLCERTAYRYNGYVTYIEMIRRLAASKKFLWIEEIFEDQKKYCVSDTNFAERFIEMYGKAGMYEHARKMFDEMPQLNCHRSVKTFNMLLHSCVQCEKYDEFAKIFREIPVELSITPDVVSYNIAIKAFSKIKSVDGLRRTMDDMELSGLEPDSVTYGSLLLGFYQSGAVSKAEKIWDLLRSKDISPCIRCYTSKITHLVSEKRMTEALELFDELKTKDIKPDKYVFSALFKGFREERDIIGAKGLYGKMKRSKCRINEFIYEMLILFASEMCDFEFARIVCLAAIEDRSFLGQATLQGVVDGLIGQSKREEAERLVASIRESSNPVEVSLELN